MGDYAFPCFLLAKELKKSPQEITQTLKSHLETLPEWTTLVEKIEIAGPYLNIYLSKSIFTNAFIDFYTNYQTKNGEIFPQKDETIIVDYIGANVGKPLHIGHMCTPNIGQSLINLYKKLGYNVIGDSHL